jgi:hypothetical protein
VHRLSHGQLYVASGAAIVIAIGAFAFTGNGHSGPPRTMITVDGARLGPQFQGIGAISGGGGNSRLLIEYPRAQRDQILDYLFKPGYGANLQILKLEIGGDAYATDGAEPSTEHAKGQVNCHAGYELWLAQQARKLDPAIQIYALQWNTPHWIGAAWSQADIGYLLDWLHCAREDHLTVNYLGGWNEHLRHGITSQVMGWFIRLRAALNAAGYASTQIVAVDSFAHENHVDVANFMTHHPAFKAAINILGYHNLSRYPSTGKTCLIPPAARTSGKPIWESEIGALRQHTGVAAMTRSIDNAYIQVGATGLIEWPLVDSMPAYLLEEDRGLISRSALERPVPGEPDDLGAGADHAVHQSRLAPHRRRERQVRRVVRFLYQLRGARPLSMEPGRPDHRRAQDSEDNRARRSGLAANRGARVDHQREVSRSRDLAQPARRRPSGRRQVQLQAVARLHLHVHDLDRPGQGDRGAPGSQAHAAALRRDAGRLQRAQVPRDAGRLLRVRAGGAPVAGIGV